MNDSVLINIDLRGVCTLSLNRPEVHNAFNDELIKELSRHLNAIKTDDSIRAVVITGMGNTFSSGADINSMSSMVKFDYQTNREDALQLARLLNTLYLLPKPTIARINGSAYGGALGLIACCDIAIASSEARFAFTEVKLGILPAVISPYIINAIGTRNSKRLFLTAKQFAGNTAQSIGLIHQVIASRDLDSTVAKEIELVLAAGPAAVAQCKQLCHKYTTISEDIIQHTADLIATVRTSDEGQEGLNAFLEKRRAKWTI